MAVKVIPQRRFLRGVNAVAPDFGLPPGALPRASNLCYKRRGALSTVDGSLILSSHNAAVQSVDDGTWEAVYLFAPTATARTYYGVKKDNVSIGVPTGLALSKVAGGTLIAGTYAYRVTALDGVGGETNLIFAETTITLTAGDIAGGNKTVGLTWTANALAVGGYKVYGRTSGAELFIATVTTNSYNDTGSVTPAGAFPTVDTTQVVRLYKIPATSYTNTEILKTYPADPIRPVDDTSGHTGGSGGGSSGPPVGNTGFTPSGGLQGNTSPLPQILQFTDKMVIALGNGYKPQLSDGTGGGTADLSNTFAASYPVWLASTTFNVGDIVTPTVANGHIFKCVTAGKSAGAQPTWPTTKDKTVADGSVIWKEAGSDSASNPPVGAAHIIVHAGALWAYNTSPTNTADGLDGPCALRMSDVNNPNSWNPLNAAFIGKDDGTQGQGLASFTIAEAGIPPTGTLIAFKDFSTYQITGVFGSSAFSIQQAQTDMGCIAPRSIQFIPGFGIVRLTHLGIAVFDGTRDRVISEEIRPYLFGGVADIAQLDWNYAYFSKGTQTASPPQYCLAIPVWNNGTAPTITSAAVVAAGGSTLPTGSYYVKVTAWTDLATEGAASGELGPVVIGANQGIQVKGPNFPATVVKYRVYFGIGSGNEKQYVDLFPADWNNQDAGASGAKTISALGTAGGIYLGGLTRVLTYDLVLKAWSVVDLPFPIGVLTQVRAQGTIPITIMGGYADGTVRRWQAGDLTWDGTAVRFFLRTPEVFGANPTDRSYFKRLLVRGVVAAGSTAALTVSVNVEGTDGSQTVTREISLGAGQFESELSIGLMGLNAHATITGSGACEIDSVDWHALPKPAGSLAAII